MFRITGCGFQNRDQIRYVVPLMAMLRHRAAAGSMVPTRLLYSSRGPDDVVYRDELASLQEAGDGLEVCPTFTRQLPKG
jgi:predicted ferric reductase